MIKLPQVEDKEQEPAARILVARPVKRYEPEFLQRFCLLLSLSLHPLTYTMCSGSHTCSRQRATGTSRCPSSMTRLTSAPSSANPDPSTNLTALGVLRFWTDWCVLCVQGLKPCKEPKAVGVLCSLTAILCMPQSRWFELCMSHDTTSKFAFILTFVDLK